MFVDCSLRLQKKIEQALTGKDSCVFSPECILHNPNTEFKFTCRYLKGMAISQDFLGSYMTTIQITTDVMPKEQIEIIKNLQDMECTLILYPYNDKTLTMIYDQDPLIFHMRVMVDNQADLEKKYNINLLGNSEDDTYLTADQHSLVFPFTFHLIEPEAYDLRHVKLNSMFSSTTPEALLHWICQQFGAESVKIIPPDNTAKLENVVIPPMHDISSIFPYIQERYAIYSKGLGYYFENKTFHIFPAHDSKQETSPAIGALNIINAPEKYFLGLDRYHNKVDDDIFIASVTPVDIKPTNAEGTENLGNVHISTNADKLRDNFVNVSTDGKVTRGKDDISVVVLQNQAGNVKSDMQNVAFKGERTNVYSSTSEMAMINGTMLKTGWLRAYPMLIQPGHHVIYHFDAKKGIYKTQKGRVLRVFYGGTLHTSESQKPWVSFNASIEIQLEADKQSEEETQTLD